MTGFVVQTKMAEAMANARREATTKGVNLGRLGRRILTNEVKGVGTRVYHIADEKKQQPTAVSAAK